MRIRPHFKPRIRLHNPAWNTWVKYTISRGFQVSCRFSNILHASTTLILLESIIFNRLKCHFFISSAARIINHYAVFVNIVSPIFKLLNKNTHILIILLHIVKLHIFDRSNYRVRYFHLAIMWLKPCRVNYLKIRKQDFFL